MFDFLLKSIEQSPWDAQAARPAPAKGPPPAPKQAQASPQPSLAEGAGADDLAAMYGPTHEATGAKPADDEKQFQVSTDPRVKKQQLKEAEQDRAKLEENLKDIPGLTDAEKQRIVDRV